MNRLAGEASPYLRQHRDNPVDWYPWSREAFEEARRRDVPILLSVGYSACHWCHVMAHESFEDSEVAAEMNTRFVCVKVDREERPDVDAVYMDAVQALTGRGGWPMTVFLTPECEPFFGGTYYPREGFLRLLSAISEIWVTRRDDVASNVAAIVEAIGRTANVEPVDGLPTDDFLDRCARFIADRHDSEWGGFGDAPKFPSTMNLDFLLRRHALSPGSGFGEVVERSLDAMAAGGIHDHLGGGFARYSVDQRWLVPHFEKMLYDQALLLRAYCHGYLELGHERWRQVVESTIGYLVRDLRHDLGGFYSAEDADSDDGTGHHHEGWFYTWTDEEVRRAVGEDADEFMEWFGVSSSGNFEGRNILHRPIDPKMFDRSDAVSEACRTLLRIRTSRPRPGLDSKVLLEWNALTISSLAECSAAFGRVEWLELAEQCAEFLFSHLLSPEGVWHRVWQEDAVPPARHAALAVDLAALLESCVRLGEVSGRAVWIERAQQVADRLIEDFQDSSNGGFFTVANNGEQLVVRQKDLMDNATPSANSLAAIGLLRLSALTARTDYREAALGTLGVLTRVAGQAPTASGLSLLALDLAVNGQAEVSVAGSMPDLLRVVWSRWRPSVVVAWGERYPGPMWDNRHDGLAYVCRNHTCSEPTADPERFATLIDASGS
ncbi:MAG: hypothetical protein RL391_489 [Actinomycetota bacterium]|jgi:uncharacterized protein YyaL (SSP411 family)